MSKITTFSQLVFSFILYVSLFTSFCITNACHENNPKNDNFNEILEFGTSNIKNFNGIFLFGTSVIDNGNNNNIDGSLAKANYNPYGIDFIYGPTGRFSNGKNVADKISDLLNLPLVPSFEAVGRGGGGSVVYGVNYGSGGSGILDNTGSIANGVINLNQQIKNFESTLPELKRLLGHDCNTKLGQYLFLIAAGNNDFLLNYLLQPVSTRPSVPAFVANLTSTFGGQLERLYNDGARKFALLTVYPLGCSPVIKTVRKSQQCVDMVNQVVSFYNTQLINVVDELKPKLPGSEFVVVHTYNIIRNIINNPIATGFSDVANSCCELTEVIPGFGLSCKEGGNVCKDRSKYVYFDGQHNTEAVNDVISAKAVGSFRRTEVYPYNLQTLAQL